VREIAWSAISHERAEFRFILSRVCLEKPLGEDRREILLAAIIPDATPFVGKQVGERGVCVLYRPRIAFAPIMRSGKIVEPVKVDIVQDVEEVRQLLDANLLGSFKKRPATLMPLVEIASVAGHFPQKQRQSVFRSFRQEQMDVVPHELPTVKIDDPFPFSNVGRCTSYILAGRATDTSLVYFCWSGVIEFKEVVHKAGTVLVVCED